MTAIINTACGIRETLLVADPAPPLLKRELVFRDRGVEYLSGKYRYYKLREITLLHYLGVKTAIYDECNRVQ